MFLKERGWTGCGRCAKSAVLVALQRGWPCLSPIPAPCLGSLLQPGDACRSPAGRSAPSERRQPARLDNYSQLRLQGGIADSLLRTCGRHPASPRLQDLRASTASRRARTCLGLGRATGGHPCPGPFLVVAACNLRECPNFSPGLSLSSGLRQAYPSAQRRLADHAGVKGDYDAYDVIH